MNEPVVYVIVLNWNRPADTIRCVESILRSDYANYRVLVVDNASTDDSVTHIRAAFPAIELMVNARNLGFSAGLNGALDYAAERGAEYVLLLNNDTVLDAAMLGELVRVALTDSHIAIVGPAIYHLDEPERCWFWGTRFRWGIYGGRMNVPLPENAPPIIDVDFISGCAMLVQRAAWAQAGKFDPVFFMYWEDLDFCRRMKGQGYRIVSAPQARMWHAVASSSGGTASPFKQYHKLRGTFPFARRHTRGWTYVVNVVYAFADVGQFALRQIARGNMSVDDLRWYIKGIVDAFKMINRDICPEYQ